MLNSDDLDFECMNATQRKEVEKILNELHMKGQAWGPIDMHGLVTQATANGITSHGQKKDVDEALQNISAILG
jgi:hypothetical protein